MLSPYSRSSQLPYWSSAGVPARETCGRGSCYHLKGLCCGHRRSERAGWDSPGEISNGFYVYAFTLSILLPLLQARIKGFTCFVLSELEYLCGPHLSLETFPPVACMFWCWPPWACHIKAQNFSLGEGRYFTGFWGACLSSPLSIRAHSTRSVASSQALFRGVPLEEICVAAGWSSPHTFSRFCNLDLDTALGSQVLSVWTGRVCCLVRKWGR